MLFTQRTQQEMEPTIWKRVYLDVVGVLTRCCILGVVGRFWVFEFEGMLLEVSGSLKGCCWGFLGV